MVRRVAIVVGAMAGLVVVGIIAKLSLLGAWSAAFYVLVSIALLVIAGVALYFGARRDAQNEQNDPDNDY